MIEYSGVQDDNDLKKLAPQNSSKNIKISHGTTFFFIPVLFINPHIRDMNDTTSIIYNSFIDRFFD